ncbi:MAG: hypothetical protein M0P57_05500 [Syntrophales bacterium]|nr:hypothetical protein [Syntrophales bacterium]
MDMEKSDFIFLGREFLTWLWFKSEERNGSILIENIGDIELLFFQRIVLESGEGEYSETVACRGLHADLKEGKAALKMGKRLKEARLKMSIGSDEWEFTFKADDFDFQSMKMPARQESGESDDEAEREGRMLERVYMIEKPMNMMEKLFAVFLKKRSTPLWSSEELPRMEQWFTR